MPDSITLIVAVIFNTLSLKCEMSLLIMSILLVEDYITLQGEVYVDY